MHNQIPYLRTWDKCVSHASQQKLCAIQNDLALPKAHSKATTMTSDKYVTQRTSQRVTLPFTSAISDAVSGSSSIQCDKSVSHTTDMCKAVITERCMTRATLRKYHSAIAPAKTDSGELSPTVQSNKYATHLAQSIPAVSDCKKVHDSCSTTNISSSSKCNLTFGFT